MVCQIKVNKMQRTIEIYMGYTDGTWDTDYIDIFDEGLLPIEDLVQQYMEKHDDDFSNMVFYGIYNIPNDEDE